MIKKFSEFIKESNSVYNQEKGVYGESLFESITNSLMESINESINEGKIDLGDNLLNEGFFTNLFKGAAKKADDNAIEANTKKEYFQELVKQTSSGGDLIKLGAQIKKEEISEIAWKYINRLCEDGVELCEKITKKEEEVKLTITNKLNETKELIAEYAKKAKETFETIATKSENAIVDIINTMRVVISKLAESTMKAMKEIGKGAIIGATLPFVLIYSTYKSAKALIIKLSEKVKDIATDVKDAVDKYGALVSEWFKTQLQNLKTAIKELADKTKSAGEKAVRDVTKAYLYVIGVCGLVIDKASTATKEAYESFIESAKEYSTEIKDYIVDRWEKVSTWTQKKSGEFVDGVKSIWNSVTDKVHKVVDATKDAAERLKEYGNEKIDQLENWSTSKQQSFCKSIFIWAADKWGADTVKAWID